MFGNKVTAIPGRSGINLNSILNGLSRGLNVAGRAIPLYQEAKPLFKNASAAFTTIKTFMNSNNKKVVNAENKKSHNDMTNNFNGPKLFI